VYVIDDDASVRNAVRRLLASVSVKVESYVSSREFLQNARLDSPSCLVLDIRLPDCGSGFDVQDELVRKGIRIPIIFITGHGDAAMSVRAMKAGAIDFLTKPFDAQELLDSIQRSIDLDRAYRREQAELESIKKRHASLSSREKEVMALVVTGMSNKQIAFEIGVRLSTVKAHRGKVMRKMQADSVPDLVREAKRLATTWDLA
jgi:FixJ family two-component response regulator